MLSGRRGVSLRPVRESDMANTKPGGNTKQGGQAPDAVEAFERLTEVSGRAQQMMMEFWTGEALTQKSGPGEAIVRPSGLDFP